MGHAEQLARRHRKRPRNCTRKASPSLRCRSCRTSLIEALRRSQFAQIIRRMAQRFDLNGSARPCAVRGMNCAMPSAPWETSVARAAVWRYVRPCCSALRWRSVLHPPHCGTQQCCRHLCVSPRAHYGQRSWDQSDHCEAHAIAPKSGPRRSQRASCIRPRPRRGLLQACGSRPRHPLCACHCSVEHRSLLGVDYPTARPVRWASRTPARSIADARLAGIVAVRSVPAMSQLSENHPDKLAVVVSGPDLGRLLALVRHRQPRDGEPLRPCRGLGYQCPVRKVRRPFVNGARPRSFIRRREDKRLGPLMAQVVVLAAVAAAVVVAA
jgi:hypothetical protein